MAHRRPVTHQPELRSSSFPVDTWLLECSSGDTRPNTIDSSILSKRWYMKDDADAILAKGKKAFAETEALLTQWRAREAESAAATRALAPLRDHPAATLDGDRVCLEANVELLEELPRVKESGAEGIGLYRSEFLLETRPAGVLDEDAQYDVYRTLVETMAPSAESPCFRAR